MNHTPGQWYWHKDYNNRWSLCSPLKGRMIVMDFVRFGMQGAQPRFSDRAGSLRGGIMHDATDLGDLNQHPDAHLLACAPALLDAAEELIPFLPGEVYQLDSEEFNKETRDFTPFELAAMKLVRVVRMAKLIPEK